MNLCALDPLLYPERETLHKDFIDDLYQLVAHSIQTPYAISIDGLWGTGKTTVMKMLQSKLQEAYYPVFWFNPWEYRQSDNVVVAFLRSLATKNKNLLDEITKRSGMTILAVLAETAMDVGLSKLTDGKIALKDIKESFKSVEENQKFSFTNYDDIVETIKKEFIDLTDRISKQYEGKPVIVFFDDLDRCLPDDAIKLLEALKNLFVTQLEAPEKKRGNSIFICGIDTHIAKQFIQEHYRGIEETFAINYFRKIFNLTVSMPQSPKIEEVLSEHIKNMEVSDLLSPERTKALAQMVSARGLQMHLSSIRTYLNIVTNFCVFLKFNRKYSFTPEKFDPIDDFTVNLLMVKEAWQPIYEYLIQESLRKLSIDMEELIQYVITQKELSAEQKEYFSSYLGKESSFAQENLSEWLAEYPTLA